MDPSGEFLVNPVTIGIAIGGVTGAIQAANASGGWSFENAGDIALGALTGAVAGGATGLIPGAAGWLGAASGGALAGVAGNLANQWLGDTSFECTNWWQAGTQGAFGAISGAAGSIAGLSAAFQAVSAGKSVKTALSIGDNFGGIYGGAAQAAGNLAIPTDLGGFWPSSNDNTCKCKK